MAAFPEHAGVTGPEAEEDYDWSRPVRFGGAFYVAQSCRIPRRVVVPRSRPRSARHVGSVWWSWSPGNSRSEQLYLSFDRSRRFYLLWFEWSDDGFSESRIAAYVPRKGLDPRAAAISLITANYQGEEREYASAGGPWVGSSPGLLDSEELMLVAELIWSDIPGHHHSDSPATDRQQTSPAVPNSQPSSQGRFLSMSMIAEFQRDGRASDTFVALLDERGEGGVGVACLWHPLDDSEFDPYILEGRGISEERLDALCAGAAPTSSELELWRQVEQDTAFESCRWNPAILWRAVADDGMTLYGTALQEDGGSWAGAFGPFLTPEAALEDLRSRGEVTDVRWPDEQHSP